MALQTNDDWSSLPPYVEKGGGEVIMGFNSDRVLVMRVNPLTLPPDLFRKLFPSGKPGIFAETLQWDLKKSPQSPASQTESSQAG